MVCLREWTRQALSYSTSVSTQCCTSRNWNPIFYTSAPVSVLPAATTMWEEPLASRRCSSPTKAESPSLFPSLLLPSFFTHEEEKMTITSRQSFNVLTVIFLLLSTAGLYNLGWLLQWLLTAAPHRQGTRAWSNPCKTHFINWLCIEMRFSGRYHMRTMTWIQERRPKYTSLWMEVDTCMARS